MNKLLPNRRSIRLKGYDYSAAGLYFVTICVQNKTHLFGDVIDGAMELNDAGKMIKQWYNEIENKFPDIQCCEMIIMPNHIHFIVQNVGADLRVCPSTATNEHNSHIMGEHNSHIMGEHIGSPLHRVVQWFKTMTTNNYIRGVKNENWEPFDGKLWQRNYYEHIIREEYAYRNIANYIINNPATWENDVYKKENTQ